MKGVNGKKLIGTVAVAWLVFAGPMAWAQKKAEAEDPRVASAARKLKDGFPEVRAQGIVTLGELGARHYTKQIAALVKGDPDAQVRFYGIETLVKFDAKECAPDIAELLKDRVQAGVRVKAADAVGRFAAKGYDPNIAKLLQHNDAMVRGRLVQAFGRAEAKAYAKDIAPLAGDSQRCTLYDEKIREFRNVTTVGKTAKQVLSDWGMSADQFKKK